MIHNAYVKELTAVGFTEQQAEVQTNKFVDVIEDKLTTKRNLRETEYALRRDMKEMEQALRRDMKEMEQTLRRDMKEMETGLRHDMKEMELRIMTEIVGIRGDMGHLKADILKWVAGMLLAQSAVIATLVKLL